jgi:hypothetical protein
MAQEDNGALSKASVIAQDEEFRCEFKSTILGKWH